MAVLILPQNDLNTPPSKPDKAEYNGDMPQHLHQLEGPPALSYTIEEASLRDLNALRRLERICFQQDAWGVLDLIAVLTLPDIIRLKAITHEHEMIGFIAGDPRPSKGFSWIATIGVLPKWRSRGIGRALMEACESRMTTPRIRLTVRIDNHTAIRLYESMGYRTITTLPNYYRDGAAAILMEKMNLRSPKGV
jgi:ribosomal-protein-alanine N-acetyltransferase